MIKLGLLAVLSILTGCAQNKTVVLDPASSSIGESIDEMLLRTENTSCANLTYHDSAKFPDCERIYNAALRGRARVEAVYPAAKLVKLDRFSFYQPPLEISPSGKPYPVIQGLDVRGVTYVQFGLPLIEYSYEEVVEHEIIHALVYLLDGARVRELGWREAGDFGGFSPLHFDTFPFFFYLITCHGTLDDPFGARGNVSSCIENRDGF